MPKNTKGSAGPLSGIPENATGMPAKDGITGITKALKYLIIHTKEMDAYDKGAGLGIAPAVAAPAPTGDNYQGSARKAAKLSIAAAKTENFTDVKDVIASLVPDAQMIAKKIPTTASSGRVKEEERNVHVTAFLYAASMEADNDFHLIIGRDPKSTPEMYMTMEVSGLPPAGAASFTQLNAARAAFKAFFQSTGGTLPGLAYDFYQPPIPVQVDGSLFFDTTHATGPHPGPPSLKSRMPTIWEVHPISKLVLT